MTVPCAMWCVADSHDCPAAQVHASQPGHALFYCSSVPYYSKPTSKVREYNLLSLSGAVCPVVGQSAELKSTGTLRGLVKFMQWGAAIKLF